MIHARHRLDLGLLENRNTIHSGGELAIGGGLTADGRASGVADALDNTGQIAAAGPFSVHAVDLQHRAGGTLSG